VKTDLDTKERILRAAKSEFAVKGFAGARMESIAIKAKANKAMIHYYFGSKEKLYKEVLIFIVGGSPKSDTMYSKCDTMNPPEKLITMVYFLVSMHSEGFDPDFHRMMAWDFAEGKSNMKLLVKNYIVPGLERLESIVKEGIKTGDFETKHPLLVVWNFVSFLITFVGQRNMFKNTDLYEKLHPDDSKAMLLDFFSTHIFKELLPGNKSLKIPEVPKTFKTEMDKILKEMQVKIRKSK